MFIALGHNEIPAPFGGAERGRIGTCQLDFRPSERRRRLGLALNYKHLIPNGVKPKEIGRRESGVE